MTPFYSTRGRSPVRIQAAELQGAGEECGEAVPRRGHSNGYGKGSDGEGEARGPECGAMYAVKRNKIVRDDEENR